MSDSFDEGYTKQNKDQNNPMFLCLGDLKIDVSQVVLEKLKDEINFIPCDGFHTKSNFM